MEKSDIAIYQIDQDLLFIKNSEGYNKLFKISTNSFILFNQTEIIPNDSLFFVKIVDTSYFIYSLSNDSQFTFYKIIIDFQSNTCTLKLIKA